MLKLLHLGFVVMFFASHALAGLWLIMDHPMPSKNSPMWRLYASLMVLLIVSGLWLFIESGQHLILSSWIHATFLHLIIFFCLVHIAFRLGPTKTVRAVAWVASVPVYFQATTIDMVQDPRGVIAIWHLFNGAVGQLVEELQAGASKIKVSYVDLPNGAEIKFETTDIRLLMAIHRWFRSQLSEHGSDAMSE